MNASYCYLLYTANLRNTYIGATVDPDRRLRQHNQELVGGARRTKGNQWARAVHIGGFPDWKAALQFEWSWKRHGRGKYGLSGKIQALYNLVHSERSTSKAIPFRDWNQKITIYPASQSTDILEKIESFRNLCSESGRANNYTFFLKLSALSFFPKMSSTNTILPNDMAQLAHTVEDLSLRLAEAEKTIATLSANVNKAKPAGRPKKAAVAETDATEPVSEGAEVKADKPKRGRKAKVVAEVTTDATVPVAEVKSDKPKKAGRPKKVAEAPVAEAPVAEAPVAEAPVEIKADKPKKAGRPKKTTVAEAPADATAPATEATDEAPAEAKADKPKKRGPKAKPVAEAPAVAEALAVAEAPVVAL